MADIEKNNPITGYTDRYTHIDEQTGETITMEFDGFAWNVSVNDICEHFPGKHAGYDAANDFYNDLIAGDKPRRKAECKQGKRE